jgi:SAM-dependent methyltransferase
MRELHCDSDGIITKEIYEPRIEQWNINRYKVFQSLVNKVIKLVGKGAKILDLGAGEGFFAKCCKENGLNVVAVEGSPVAVKYARETLNIDSKVHNLKYPLEFEDEAFDLVMYHDIYEHVTPEINDNVFKEVFRMLKPKGFFWVITTCKYDFVECPHPEHINNPTPTSLLKVGRKLGFSGKINLSSFNISLFTPYFYDKELNTKPSQVKIRLFLKKHKKFVTMILAPLWVPIGLLNKHILKLPLLDFIWSISNVLFQKKEAR